MQSEADFREYYRHTIEPELIRQERQRRRLLLLFTASAAAIALVVLAELFLGILALTLFLLIPIILYIGYLVSRAQRFRRYFKPSVVNLILQFISQQSNYGDLSYDANKSIPKKLFLSSGIFQSKAPFYKGEDFIKGLIGEMQFELCELDVRELSPISNQLSPVFQGFFVHAHFNEPTTGQLIVWPRSIRQDITRSIKAFTRIIGKNVEDEIMIDAFRAQYLVYAGHDTHVIGILPEPMQEAILQQGELSGRQFCFSVQNQEIFVALPEDRDMLEPNIFSSNLEYELIYEFYLDIQLALSLIEAFDQTH